VAAFAIIPFKFKAPVTERSASMVAEPVAIKFPDRIKELGSYPRTEAV
jgi:hypothetical protein